jgi:heme A synthase
MTTASQSPVRNKLYAASWGLVAYTILIIAWGAWVRISGSGDGCGDHWPLCQGEAVPIGKSVKTWIEVSHRYSTALFGLLVLGQMYAVRRFTALNNPARWWVWMTLVFTIFEALIGRQLVKLGLVNESESISRLVVMPIHLINTSLLLLSEVMTAEGIAFGMRARQPLRASAKRWSALVGGVLLLLLTSGAIAALGAHLFPSVSLLDGLLHDFSDQAHPALRLRILHPVLALILPVLIWLALSHRHASTPALARMYREFGAAVLVMMVIGIATLASLSPVWLKFVHLTMANILVVLAARCLFHTLRPE